MTNPIAQRAAEWEAEAVAKCAEQKDELDAMGLCYVCMCNYPCLCDDRKIVDRMYAYYDRNRRGDFEQAKTVSWGAGNPIRELLLNLMIIATDEHERCSVPPDKRKDPVLRSFETRGAAVTQSEPNQTAAATPHTVSAAPSRGLLSRLFGVG